MTDYDFRSLSPIDFEEMARDLLNAHLNREYVTFAVGPDGGVDLRHSAAGFTSIAQCKHQPDLKKGQLLGILERELKHWAGKSVDEYLFVTSAVASPDVETALSLMIKPSGASSNAIWHRGRLNQSLADHPEVEKRHFKLWLTGTGVLDRILNAGQWQRSEDLLQRVSDRVRLYVSTDAYAAAADILAQSHVVIISGAPGVGKSTLAEMLLLSHWHDGWTVVDIASDVTEAWNAYRSNSDKVIFHYDDFLGQTNVAEMQKNEATQLSLLIDRIRGGDGSRKLILTSRDQVIAQAQSGPDDRISRLRVDEGRTRVELAELDRATKAKILFNHLYFAVSETADRNEISKDRRTLQIVDHANFNPRTIESATLRKRFDSVDDLFSNLLEGLDRPDEVWTGSFRQLSSNATEMLLQMAASSAREVSLEELRVSVGTPPARDWHQALKVLEGSWLRLTNDGSSPAASLWDASRRDFLQSLLNDLAYAEDRVDKMSSISQLNYLLELRGGRDEADLLERASGRIVGVASVEIANASKAEIAVRKRNDAARDAAKAAGEKSWSYESWNRHRYLGVLAEMASVLGRFDRVGLSSDPELEPFLSQHVGDLIDEADRGVDSAALFDLAGRLWILNTATWTSSAVGVAGLALNNVSMGDELGALYGLPETFLQAVIDAFPARLKEILEEDLREVYQAPDPDSIDNWIDEIESHALALGVDIDTAAERERNQERRHEWRDRPHQAAPPSLQPAPKSSSSDVEIMALFARLAE